MQRQFILAVSISIANIAPAQQQTTAANSPTARIPIRQLSSPSATARDTLGSVSGIKQFSDGRVLVHDVVKRRVIVFDSALKAFTISADTTGKGAPYPTSMFAVTMFDYVGDSAIFPDWTSQAFLVIEPSGKIGRAIAHPNGRDMGQIIGTGSTAFDPQGRLFYRTQGTSPFRGRADAAAPPPRSRDTVAIVRANFNTRAIDTLGRVDVPFAYAGSPVTRDANGKPSARQIINPLPHGADDWVVTSDGSLAMVRPSDYHIDWVYADGSKASTPKMPFDWRRLTDADKQARIDSAKRVIDSLLQTPRGYGRIMSSRPGGGMDTVQSTFDFAPYTEMPDYVPPFRPMSIRADRDNNIWIPPTTTFAQTLGGVVYDVINRKGEIFERVVIPGGRLIAGFGPNGVVYLLNGNRTTGFVLERRHILRTGS